MATTHCCAECGKEGGASLKVCKACMLARYCNANCQSNHWSTHKIECKQRAAELRDEALFKDPPAKEDCPICFLPLPKRLICCISLPPATRISVPIYDLAIANEELALSVGEAYYPCCGKEICGGCVDSFYKSGNRNKCPFCNADQNREKVEQIHKRVAANDASAICRLANFYHHGVSGFQQDHARAIELFTRSAELGFSKAHYDLADFYYKGGDLKKAKFHYEAAAMAGDEEARYNLGCLENNSGNSERAVKHLKIAASAGFFRAMHGLISFFQEGRVSRELIDTTLAAYNEYCAEMRSEARDTYIRFVLEMNARTNNI